MRAIDYLTQLASSGRYCFTTRDAEKALGSTLTATRAALRRLVRRGAVASPYRGFFVVLPPEYRRLGCLPPEQLVPHLMAELELEYYAGLLSAAQYHGAAHHRPQEFQVMVAKNRPGVACGAVRVRFIARAAIASVPTSTVNTPRGPLKISTAEATALDLVGYPHHAGGIDNAATVLAELAEVIDPGKLVGAATTAPLAWAQRLGYLLERVEADRCAAPLAAYVKEHARELVPLSPSAEKQILERSSRWRLDVNVTVEPDV